MSVTEAQMMTETMRLAIAVAEVCVSLKAVHEDGYDQRRVHVPLAAGGFSASNALSWIVIDAELLPRPQTIQSLMKNDFLQKVEWRFGSRLFFEQEDRKLIIVNAARPRLDSHRIHEHITAAQM